MNIKPQPSATSIEKTLTNFISISNSINKEITFTNKVSSFNNELKQKIYESLLKFYETYHINYIDISNKNQSNIVNYVLITLNFLKNLINKDEIEGKVLVNSLTSKINEFNSKVIDYQKRKITENISGILDLYNENLTKYEDLLIKINKVLSNSYDTKTSFYSQIFKEKLIKKLENLNFSYNKTINTLFSLESQLETIKTEANSYINTLFKDLIHLIFETCLVNLFILEDYLKNLKIQYEFIIKINSQMKQSFFHIEILCDEYFDLKDEKINTIDLSLNNLKTEQEGNIRFNRLKVSLISDELRNIVKVVEIYYKNTKKRKEMIREMLSFYSRLNQIFLSFKKEILEKVKEIQESQREVLSINDNKIYIEISNLHIYLHKQIVLSIEYFEMRFIENLYIESENFQKEKNNLKTIKEKYFKYINSVLESLKTISTNPSFTSSIYENSDVLIVNVIEEVKALSLKIKESRLNQTVLLTKVKSVFTSFVEKNESFLNGFYDKITRLIDDVSSIDVYNFYNFERIISVFNINLHELNDFFMSTLTFGLNDISNKYFLSTDNEQYKEQDKEAYKDKENQLKNEENEVKIDFFQNVVLNKTISSQTKEKLNFQIKQKLISIKSTFQESNKDNKDNKDNEIIINQYNCAHVDTMILQGILYITSKGIKFISFFNKTTFLGKTVLFVPFDEINEIEKAKYLKIFDNSLKIITKRGELLFTSFVNREQCFNEVVNEYKQYKQCMEVYHKLDLTKKEESLEEKGRVDKRKGKNLTEKEKILYIIDCIIKQSFYIDRLKEEEANRLKILKTGCLIIDHYNKLKEYFIEEKEGFKVHIYENKHISKLPACYIFSLLFNNKINIKSLEFDSSFWESVFKMRKSKDVVLRQYHFIEKEGKIEKENISLEEYLLKHELDVFSLSNQVNNQFFFIDILKIKSFLKKKPIQINKFNWPIRPFVIEYHMTTPLKKRMFVPEESKFKIVYYINFISPLYIIIDEISIAYDIAYSNTFYSHNQYRFNSELQFFDGIFRFDTYFNCFFKVNFISNPMIKSLIESEGNKEGPESIRSITFPSMISCIDEYESEFIENYSLSQKEEYRKLGGCLNVSRLYDKFYEKSNERIWGNDEEKGEGFKYNDNEMNDKDNDNKDNDKDNNDKDKDNITNKINNHKDSHNKTNQINNKKGIFIPINYLIIGIIIIIISISYFHLSSFPHT